MCVCVCVCVFMRIGLSVCRPLTASLHFEFKTDRQTHRQRDTHTDRQTDRERDFTDMANSQCFQNDVECKNSAVVTLKLTHPYQLAISQPYKKQVQRGQPTRGPTSLTCHTTCCPSQTQRIAEKKRWACSRSQKTSYALMSLKTSLRGSWPRTWRRRTRSPLPRSC